MVELRAARPEEAAALSELALRSKAYWGYSAKFLDAARVQLTFTAASVAAMRMTVAEADGRVVGFYAVEGAPPEGELSHLWVDPPAIGTGVGRRLWEHAVDTAHAAGFTSLHLDADPNAEGFYLAMGARRIGASPSAVVPGRMLPALRVALS
jgi:GNAT superfamily N-acetyltransferase